MADIFIVVTITKVSYGSAVSYCLEMRNVLMKAKTAVESDGANKMMDLIRERFVNGDLSKIDVDGSGIKLVKAEEFE